MEKPRALVAALVLLVWTAAAAAQEQETPEFAGEHFRIVLEPGGLAPGIARLMGESALKAVETAYPVYAKLLGVRDAERHTIRLYVKPAAFLTAEARLSPFRFASGAFVDASGEGHVNLGPARAPEVMLHIGLPQAAVEGLLRAAAEQLVAPLVPEEDDGWIRGILVMAAVEAVTNPEHLPGVDLGHDGRRAWAYFLAKRGGNMALDNLLDLDMKPRDVDDLHHLQAWSAMLAQFFAACDARWVRRLTSKRRPTRESPPQRALRAERLQAIVGRNTTKAEVAFSRMQRGFAPRWSETVPLFSLAGGRGMLAGTADKPAIACLLEPLPDGPFAIAGRLELIGVPQGLRLAFGEDEQSMAVVLFRSDEAMISVWHKDKTDYDDKARAGKQEKDRWGDVFDFRIEVDDEEIRVAVEGVPRLAWPHGGRPVHGELSLQINKGLCVFEDLRVEPLRR